MAVRAARAVMLAGEPVGMVSVARTNPATVCMPTWAVVVEGAARPISGCSTVVCLAVAWPAMVSWRSLPLA